ncbi:flagellar basal-body MS-ring/collar protein FliF [Sulfurimonas xiamenensis]|uniref:Flagellar M-ring protein FliF n=1 Tax=Sulfurimonas xiamenensis TaxID=2590021 RepID=A0AAJ4A2R7_9BACT|nr:flagellar basal-body MS-ring/collar protein FliF [Sulfurimonas xiamenensis]QFR42748.1 flagellar M-ring protein FliF [Sulfurimonas xiamenensis]
MNSKVLFSQLFVLKNRLSKKQKLIIGSAVAAIIIFLIFLSVYTAEKNINSRYEVLFGSLASADAAKVIEELEKKSISYELLDNNIIKIPRNILYKERIAIASLGIVKKGSVSLSAEDFKQNEKYFQALEDELSRTINALSAVENVSVRLTLEKNATALVLLQLTKGRELSLKQIRGIENLVAAAVPNLSPSDVVLIDNNTEIIASIDEMEQLTALSIMQQNFKANEEKKKERKIIEAISPYIGKEKKIAAQVNIDFDFSVKEPLSDTYNSEFAQIKKIMVTVIVDGNYKYKSDADGNPTNELEYEPLSENDLKTLSLLVSRLIGINKERGDQISVKNAQFKIAEVNALKNKTDVSFFEFLKYLFVFIFLFIVYIKLIAPFAKKAFKVSKKEQKSSEIFLDSDVEKNFYKDEDKYTISLDKMKIMIDKSPEAAANIFQALIAEDAQEAIMHRRR